MRRRGFLRAIVIGVALAFPVSRLRIEAGAGFEQEGSTHWLVKEFMRSMEASRVLSSSMRGRPISMGQGDIITVRRPHDYRALDRPE